MDSATKRRLTDAEIEALVHHAFGIGVEHAQELDGGSYAAVYAVRLGDGRETVLKISPPPQLPLLTYEADLAHAEVLFNRAAAAVGVPVPEVYFADLSGEMISSDYLFLQRLPGQTLRDVRDRVSAPARARLRYTLGGLAARLHGVQGPSFGYPRRDGRTHAPGWRVSFLSMIDDVLDDARRLRCDLGTPVDRVEELVHRRADVLDEVTRPALVHFDLWDGNVQVTPDGSDGWAVRGLLDGERMFYGDPYAELVSLTLPGDVDDEPELLAGYAAQAGGPLVLDAGARTRVTLYTVYLYLMMLTEGGTRRFGGERYERLTRARRARLCAVLERLARP